LLFGRIVNLYGFMAGFTGVVLKIKARFERITAFYALIDEHLYEISK
jgi:hypothetical protein